MGKLGNFHQNHTHTHTKIFLHMSKHIMDKPFYQTYINQKNYD